MEDKKSIYEKPSLKIVKVELNECIAASNPEAPGPTVKQGSSVHQIVNSSPESIAWGDKIIHW